ncbi:hypothetical protein GPLA_1060 [Paraglaciecola polaris LMG 21857]|uniref:Uncharacterized protein n=1 Tax=Paraglaciecola polaris LMG 21857 TaxID=1129793 RepID=K6Z710_9ALTE|nr:hypothetical protein GPLA_1060 [Paraglaciecola polaris LMG 21857]
MANRIALNAYGLSPLTPSDEFGGISKALTPFLTNVIVHQFYHHR